MSVRLKLRVCEITAKAARIKEKLNESEHQIESENLTKISVETKNFIVHELIAIMTFTFIT